MTGGGFDFAQALAEVTEIKGEGMVSYPPDVPIIRTTVLPSDDMMSDLLLVEFIAPVEGVGPAVRHSCVVALEGRGEAEVPDTDITMLYAIEASDDRGWYSLSVRWGYDVWSHDIGEIGLKLAQMSFTADLPMTPTLISHLRLLKT